ncbi:nucleic acid-binding, OB-fold, replication protein A, OB domain protein [Tanacetum coccineum]
MKVKIHIQVLDKTGSVSLTLFDHLANTLLDKDANELVKKTTKDYNLSKNKYVFGISQIYEEVDVIEELELKVPSIKANDSVSASATGDANSLIVSLMDVGRSPVKRKLKDDIDVDELFNASSTKKKLLDH